LAKKIYIVEDNEKNMSLFYAILKTMPDVEIASEMNGDAGFELVRDGDPDLVILDIQLPGMNGMEICKELRKLDKFQSTPIIAVTAFTMKGDQERIMAAGFTKYVSKPIRVGEFKEIINSLLP
jgi:two-component system cell cycle response regulator DivK